MADDDNDDDQHIVLNFQPRRKPRRETGRTQPAHLRSDPEDIVASAAVVAALVVAVAMASGWIPFSGYTIGILAGLAALAIGAKVLKARRSKTSATNFRR
jgi:hypothetical protein